MVTKFKVQQITIILFVLTGLFENEMKPMFLLLFVAGSLTTLTFLN